MRRDDELLRQILLDFQNDDDWDVLDVTLTAGTSDADRRRYGHILLLFDAGLVDQVGSGSLWRLTNAGHDYLQAIQSDTIWKKTKDAATSVGGMTLGMMKDLAIAYLKQEAAEKLGIEL